MQAGAAVENYDANADALAGYWRALDPLVVHAPVLHLFPARPSRVLDIGAGAGGDAAWFAGQGHSVLAVEPADGLRRAGERDFPSPLIEWLDDRLPELAALTARRETFDLVLMSAVWAHLDHGQRAEAMPNVAANVAAGGRLILSIRDGWSLPERPTWEARPDETIRLAEAEGLKLVFRTETESVQAFNRSHGVTWWRLAFERA